MFITNYIVQHIRREFLLTERSKKGSYDQNPYENMDWDNVYIQAEENVSIGLWVLKANEPKGCLLFLHGNASNRADFTINYQMHRFVDAGYTIVVPDYREFGDSDGIFEVSAVNLDIAAAHKYCVDNLEMEPVIIGFSLGGAIALEYFKHSHCKNKLILISTFSSSLDILNEQKLYWLATFLFPSLEKTMISEFNYASDDNISVLDPKQVYILHGKKDTLIPISHARKLQAKINCGYHYFGRNDHTNILLNPQLISLITRFVLN